MCLPAIVRAKWLRFFIFSFFIFIVPFFLHQNPASARTRIPDSAIHKVASFREYRKHSNQGATIAGDYYVYSDCSTHSKCVFKVVRRDTCKQVGKKLSLSGKWISGLYYKKNSKYVTVMSHGDKYKCIKLDDTQPTIVGKKHCSKPQNVGYSNISGLSQKLIDEHQGTAAHANGYVFKVSGLTGSDFTIIVAKKRSGHYTKVAEYYIPGKKHWEPEGISIDYDTGDFYINYDRHKSKNSKHKVVYYRIDGDVFRRFTNIPKPAETNAAFGAVCQNNSVKPGTGAKSSTKSNTKSSSESSNSSGSNGKSTASTKPKKHDPTVHTTFFGTFKDDGKGCGVYMVLNFIIDILTYGIAIAAAIGIAISGVLYLTARGNEAQATKAKIRIYEIVVGLAAYAVLWAALSWLLPGGKLNNSGDCVQVSISIQDTSIQPPEASNQS